MQDFTTAMFLYTQAINTWPFEPVYFTNRAAVYMYRKQFEAALSDCRQAAKLQKSAPCPKTLLRLAKCHFALGSTKPALTALRQLLSIEPFNVVALKLREKASVLNVQLAIYHRAKHGSEWTSALCVLKGCQQTMQVEGTGVPTKWRCWQIGLELTHGNWDAANEIADEVLCMDRDSARVWMYRGLVSFLMADMSSALQNLTYALELDHASNIAKKLQTRVQSVEGAKEEGNVLFRWTEYCGAIEKYSEALEIVGEKEEEGKGGRIRAILLSNRAAAWLKMQVYTQALQDIDASLELFPHSYKALRTRGRIYVHSHNYEAAISDFKDAVGLAQENGSVADVQALKLELNQALRALERKNAKDYYAILERHCTEKDVRNAYRRQSFLHHPDKGGDEEKFKLVVNAYEVLSDREQREVYDKTFEYNRSPC